MLRVFCYSTIVCDLSAVLVPRSRPVRLISPFRSVVRLVPRLITCWVDVLVRLVNRCRNVARDPFEFSIPIGLCVRCCLCVPCGVGSRRLTENATCRQVGSPLYSLLASILGRTRVFMALTVVRANMRGRLGYVRFRLLDALALGRVGHWLLTYVWTPCVALGVGMNRMCSDPGRDPTSFMTSLLSSLGMPYANRLGARWDSVPSGMRMAMLLVGLRGLQTQSSCRLTGRLLALSVR